MGRAAIPLLILVGGYGALLITVYLTQDGMVYFPEHPGRELTLSPEHVNLAYEDVEIRTSDGLTLHGWFVPAENNYRGTLLFFHGNAGNISHRLDSIVQFHEQDLSVLIIDYRGYGLSQGRPTEVGTYQDSDAAWRYLTEERGIESSEIVIFGRSLGGSIAAWLAAQHAPRALIVESTFLSALQLAQEFYWFLPVRWISRFKYNTGEYVARVDAPVLVIHSRDDGVIPLSHGQAVFQAVQGRRMFLEIEGPHDEAHLVSKEKYMAGLTEFLDGLFGDSR